MSHMLADDDDDNLNNDADMDYLQQIEAALQDAEADDDAHRQHLPVNRRQRSAEDSDYDVTRSTSDPQSTNNRTTDAPSTASKPQQQRSRHLATGLVAHAHAKRKYTEVIEQLTKEENKRNQLLLKTLPEATAARYKYHLDVSFKTSAVRNLVTHLSGSNDSATAPARGRHSASTANLPPLFAQLMKTLVMHVTELARELQLADIRAGVVQKQAQVSAEDRQVLGLYSNQVYESDAAVAELQAVEQELQAVRQSLSDDAKMSESPHEQPSTAATEAEKTSSAPAETVKPNGGDQNGSAVDVKSENVNAEHTATSNGRDASPASAAPAVVSASTKSETDNKPSAAATVDNVATQPLLGQLPAYYIRAAYMQLQQQGMVPSGGTKLRRVKR